MKPKHWLIGGGVSVITGMVLSVAYGLFLMLRVKSMASDLEKYGPEAVPDPVVDFGLAMAAGAATNLLVWGGLLALVIGIILLATRKSDGEIQLADEIQRLRTEVEQMKRNLDSGTAEITK